MELNEKDQNSLNEALLTKEGENRYDIEANPKLDKLTITKQLRLGFIRKVYAILTAQLFITSLFIVFGFNESVRQFYLSSTLILYIALFTPFILIIVLICSPKLTRKVPLNYLILGIWTLCEGYLVGFFSSLYDPYSVFLAASLTVTVTFALTLYAFTTEKDFTFLGGLLFVLSFIMIFLGLFFMIFGINNAFISKLYLFYLVLGVVVYSIYLIYDTQLIMGKENEFSIDDYVIAAMMVYLDIIQIFINILQLIGNRR